MTRRASARWWLSAALLVLALIVVAVRAAGLREDARQLVVTIPAGTAERLAAGETGQMPPHRIELVLGRQDVLVIRNEDSAWHQVGPYRVAPGRTLTQRFTRPGVIREACTMTPTRQVEIVVHER